jgi:hypothetical protein
MRTEEEIRAEIKRLKETKEINDYGSKLYEAQNSRLWTLRWVLEDKEA